MRLTLKASANFLIALVSLAAWWFTASEIRPELHYFLQQPAFSTDAAFFQRFVRYPGGLSDYASEFITQFFLFNIWGSLLIVLVAALLGLMAIGLIRQIAGKISTGAGIFTVFIGLSIWLQCDYHYPFYASVRLLFAFMFVWLYAFWVRRGVKGRMVAAFLLAGALFYLAGGAALFVFVAAAILIQLRFLTRKTDLIFLAGLALFSGVLPYLAYKYFFLTDLSLMYSITHSKTPMILFYEADYKLYTLYVLLPALLLVALMYFLLWRKLPDKTKPMEPERTDSEAAQKTSRKDRSGKKHTEVVARRGLKPLIPAVWLVLQLFLIVAIVSFVLVYSLDKTRRSQIEVSFYAANGDWDKVAKTALGLSKYDLFTNVEYNRALANLEKLGSDLFTYPQEAGSDGLFLDASVTSDVLFLCSDQYFELGFMHESQHWTFEAQTIFPYSPRLFKRLVEINLINRNYKLAGKFLHNLDHVMLYHDWVAGYEKYLADTALIEKDPELGPKRKNEPLDDFTTSNYRNKLGKLLEANPSNKMAFDYLVSSFLLDGDLASFKTFLDENPRYSKLPLPRAWDEALVLFYYVSGKEPSPGDLLFSKAAKDRFVGFVKAMKPFGNDWQSARQSLKKDFGTTYWYYLKCLSPKVTKAQIKKQKFDE